MAQWWYTGLLETWGGGVVGGHTENENSLLKEERQHPHTKGLWPHIKERRRAEEDSNAANKALTQASRHHAHVSADILWQQAEQAAD